MQVEKKLLLAIVVLLWLPFYVVIQQWQVSDTSKQVLTPLAVSSNCSKKQLSNNKLPNIPYIHLKNKDISKNDVLMVYGANMDTMKTICSVLPECAAFNSKGWIKVSTGPKVTESDVDIYIKDTAAIINNEGDESNSVKDAGAGVYTDHMESYEKMEQNLKIYIYPVIIGTEMQSVEDYKYGVEKLFIDLLEASHFSIAPEDADNAHFYFIPTRCTAYRKSQPQNMREVGERVAMETTRDMVNRLIQSYPYWNRSMGADHFYICAHDMGTDVAKLSHPGLLTNSIALVNTADYSKATFVAHKDISLPVHPGRGVVEWSTLGMGGAGIDPKDRTDLMFFAGNPTRGPVRPVLFDQFQFVHGSRLVRGYISDEQYLHALRTTKFCLCPSGLEAWSPRLMDALWFGCVPVIISDRYVLSLENLLNWDDIAYRIPESQVKELVNILEQIPEKELQQKQQNIIKLYQHLTWNNPPRPYDAFHSVLFQLWQRRHVSRTPKRV